MAMCDQTRIARSALMDGIEQNACHIGDLADMLAILTANPDAENAIGGIRLVALEIAVRAGVIRSTCAEAPEATS